VASAHTFFVGEEGVLVHNELHHICANKHKTKWTEIFRTMFERFNVPRGLNNPANLIELPDHKGRHRNSYHQMIYDLLSRARNPKEFWDEMENIRRDLEKRDSELYQSLCQCKRK
jgi:hypothetical protein